MAVSLAGEDWRAKAFCGRTGCRTELTFLEDRSMKTNAWIVTASALAGLLMASGAQAGLSVGAKAPDFETRGALGGKIFKMKLSQELKKGPVVLYFFPAAFTPGCTAETKEFADMSDEFKKHGATVIGMSADPVDKLAQFSTEVCRSKFAVASAGPGVVSGYDVALKSDNPAFAGKTTRTSYVISKTGNIVYAHSAMDYRDHVKNTLDAVKAIETKKK